MPIGELFGGLNFDFGAASGLAYRADVSQDIANIYRNEAIARQNEIDAQTKAKLFSDDIQFGNASNPWDAKLLKSFSENKIKELAEIAQSNPDWDKDPMIMLSMKQKKNELLNNDIIYRSERIKAAHGLMSKWFNENGDFADLPGAQQKIIEYQNYVTTGDADGNVEKGNSGLGREFSWEEPAVPIDTSKILTERAKLINPMDERFETIGGKHILRKSVRREDVMREAVSLAQDQGETGRALKYQYKTLKQNGQVAEDETFVNFIADQIWNNRGQDVIIPLGKADYDSNVGTDGMGNRISPYDKVFDPINPGRPTMETLKYFVEQDNQGNVFTGDYGLHIRKTRNGQPAFDKKGNPEYIVLKTTQGMLMPGKPKPVPLGAEINPITGLYERVGFQTTFELKAGDEGFTNVIAELSKQGILKPEAATFWGIEYGVDENNFDSADERVAKFYPQEGKKGEKGYSPAKLILNAQVMIRNNPNQRSLHDQKYFTKSKVGFDSDLGDEVDTRLNSDGTISYFNPNTNSWVKSE